MMSGATAKLPSVLTARTRRQANHCTKRIGSSGKSSTLIFLRRSSSVGPQMKRATSPEAGGLDNESDCFLKGQLQAKFQLTWRTQRVNTGTDANTVYEVTGLVGAIDAARPTGEQTRHHAPRQVEVGEVGSIKEAD